MISSSFVHDNELHLGFNMLALWGFGRILVNVIGIPCFVGLWVFSAASFSAAQIYWEHTLRRLHREMVSRRWDKREDPKILGIPICRERALAISGGSGALELHHAGCAGASGVICGLSGLLLCCAPNLSIQRFFPLPLAMPLWLGELIFATGSAFCMATGYFPTYWHAGHLGGTAVGIAYFYGVARPWLRRTGRF